jgi:two-component system sensor histidine kinase UhpB
MQTRFHHHGELPTLSDEEQLVIFRVTQESLSNIAKHARARDVDVELSFVGRTLLRVRDDGHGFDTIPAQRVNGRARGRPGGLGLSGMRERALLVGGSLDIFTAPGAGTTIELTMGVT